MEDEDRLSSLPNALLMDILSRLPLKSAVATSVLSHQWRYLWTELTRVKASVLKTQQCAIMFDRILRQLSSSKLHDFHLHLLYAHSKLRTINFLYSLWFRHVLSRNVENLTVLTEYDDYISIPTSVFNSQSLVTLKLWGLFEFNWSKIKNLSFHLPNLKELTLHHLNDFPVWFETLIKSCPILEDLSLVFKIKPYSNSLSSTVANVIAPKLKSLFICMESFPLKKKLHTRVSIDAPKLASLEIHDCFSIYEFVCNPTTLAKACIDLKNERGYSKERRYARQDEEEEEENLLREKYLWMMTKFVGGLSSVTNLKLKLETQTNILRFRNPVYLPIFSNLARLETNCLKDLMPSLHFFPNLEHLEVCLRFDNHTMEERSWSAPESIPDCLVTRLKTIQIRGLKGVDDDLGLMAYILSNAYFLEKLLVDFCMVNGASMEGQFCRSLLKLPRSSSTCEVVVPGNYVKASGNGLQDE